MSIYDKMTDCLLSRLSADSPPVITKAERSMRRARQQAPGQLSVWPHSVRATPLTGGRGVAAFNGVRGFGSGASRAWRRPPGPGQLCWARSYVTSFVRLARPRGKMGTAI